MVNEVVYLACAAAHVIINFFFVTELECLIPEPEAGRNLLRSLHCHVAITGSTLVLCSPTGRRCRHG